MSGPVSESPPTSPRGEKRPDMRHTQSHRSILPSIAAKRVEKKAIFTIPTIKLNSTDQDSTFHFRRLKRSISDSALFSATAEFSTAFFDLAEPEAIAQVFQPNREEDVQQLKEQESKLREKLRASDALETEIRRMEAPESDDEEITSPRNRRHSSRRSRDKSPLAGKHASAGAPIVEDLRVKLAGKRRRKSRGEKEGPVSPRKLNSSSGNTSPRKMNPSPHRERPKSRVPKLPVRDDAESDFDSPMTMDDALPSPKKLSPRFAIPQPLETQDSRPKVTKNIRRACTRRLLQENPEELIYDDDEHGKKVLVAGTVDQLVSMLTVRLQDFNLLRSFLLCKDHFITGEELLGKLVDVFQRARKVMEDDQQKDYVRMRVINVIKKWLNFNMNDFKEKRLVKRLKSFWREMGHGDAKERGWSDVIRNAYESVFNYREFIEQKFSMETIEGAPKPIVSKAILQMEVLASKSNNVMGASNTIAASGMLRAFISKKSPSDLTVLDIHPEEMARQLTLIDQQTFRQIEYLELLNKNFEKRAKAPAIASIQDRFNLFSGWVATQIVSQTSSKARAKYISHFISVAQKLLELQNYHGVMGIVVAMNIAAVSRLRESWKKVSGLDRWKALETLMSPIGNFRALRALHDNVPPPLIPTPTLYLKDLLFIEDGNEDWYDKEKKLISWEKIKLLGKVLARVQLAQEVPYKFHKVHIIANFLTDIKALTEDELDNLSRLRESRSAEV